MFALEQMKQWWVHVSYCFHSPFSVLDCNSFWSGVAVGVLLFGLVIVYLVGSSILRDSLKFRRNRLRLEARAIVASGEVIAGVRSTGESLVGDLHEESAEDLAEKFRTALEKKKKPMLNGGAWLR